MCASHLPVWLDHHYMNNTATLYYYKSFFVPSCVVVVEWVSVLLSFTIVQMHKKPVTSQRDSLSQEQKRYMYLNVWYSSSKKTHSESVRLGSRKNSPFSLTNKPHTNCLWKWLQNSVTFSNFRKYRWKESLYIFVTHTQDAFSLHQSY